MLTYLYSKQVAFDNNDTLNTLKHEHHENHYTDTPTSALPSALPSALSSGPTVKVDTGASAPALANVYVVKGWTQFKQEGVVIDLNGEYTMNDETVPWFTNGRGGNLYYDTRYKKWKLGTTAPTENKVGFAWVKSKNAKKVPITDWTIVDGRHAQKIVVTAIVSELKRGGAPKFYSPGDHRYFVTAKTEEGKYHELMSHPKHDEHLATAMTKLEILRFMENERLRLSKLEYSYKVTDEHGHPESNNQSYKKKSQDKLLK
jgi:hypothetical protein